MKTYENPDHPLHGQPVRRRMDAFAYGLLEVFCAHGVGHPTPESVTYMDEHGPAGAKGSWGLHGCDGCCLPHRPKDPRPATQVAP